MARSAGGDDFGKLILRVALGVLILFHGVAKILGGTAGIAGMVTKAGLPEYVAYGVYVGEIVAPLLVVLGFWTRPAAFVIVVNMVVAVWLVYMSDLVKLSPTGGWALELQGMYFVGALAVTFLGAGRFSVGGAGGRWN